MANCIFCRFHREIGCYRRQCSIVGIEPHISHRTMIDERVAHHLLTSLISHSKHLALACRQLDSNAVVGIIGCDTRLKRQLGITPHREEELHGVACRIASHLHTTGVGIRQIPCICHWRILPVVGAYSLVETVIPNNEFEIVLLGIPCGMIICCLRTLLQGHVEWA